MDFTYRGLTTRREILKSAAALAGGSLLSQIIPGRLAHAAAVGYAQQAGTAPADHVAAFRAQLGAVPIQAQELAHNVTLLSGPGGNVVVLTGKDGKVVVDTFVAPAWAKLKEKLDGMDKTPVKFVIDTHWHFDHADNNAPLHAAGATVVAHENTKKRLSEANDLAVVGMHFPPSPPDALPQRTFADTHKIRANGETLEMGHIPPAHTDTDIYVRFHRANVLHCGDLFFNGMYPYIDGNTGGSISGMIAACNKLVAMADDATKVVPGHGPLGNKADVIKFRDMLSSARERVQKLKSSGKTADEAAATKPFADFEPSWGNGFFNGEMFVKIVYLTL